MSKQFVHGAANFGITLYKNAAEDAKDKNLVLSPLSVQMACGLAYMGAAGNTAQSMAAGLGFGNAERTAIAGDFKSVLGLYNNHPMLTLANKVYIAEGHRVKDEFRDLAVKNFYSDAETINFTNSESAASTINQWVEGKTNNKIKKLIDGGSLNSDTRMILVNAIYFKGNWAVAFPKANTQKAAFYTTDTKSVQVDMMEVKSNFKFGELPELDATAVELPYQNSDLAMLIILPNKRDGLRNLESKLTPQNILDVSKQLQTTEVVVKLPKFRIESEIEMKDILSRMGMSDMFSGQADFSNLLETSEPLAVSKVIHKAFIEVNEEGTEAAASTGVLIELHIDISPPKFEANRSFFFVILQRNISLFSGKVFKPTSQ